MQSEFIAIIDFGSQYTQLIARRVRELGVYSEILTPDIPVEEIKKKLPKGLILSGGPASVYEKYAPRCDERLFRAGIPILGICYGLQLTAFLFGGKVSKAGRREYGHAILEIREDNGFFDGVPKRVRIWMSHGDKVESLPDDFEILGSTENCYYGAVRNKKIRFYGVQFHPEVIHTEYGDKIFYNFLYKICKCIGGWDIGSFIQPAVDEIEKTIDNKACICALSGGVDSSVTATLVSHAIGDRLFCIFVNNGFLRKDEAIEIEKIFKEKLNLNIISVDASDRFLAKLKHIEDPEEKRKTIGEEFINVFKEEAEKLKDKDRNIEFLAQGTLYPDVIESRSAFGGPSAKIKTHHNVGGLPTNLGFKLVEPLKYLFKDEVRELARELGLPREIRARQPFPGPGLAVRIIGEVTKDRLNILREADKIVTQEIENAGLNNRLWQYFAVLLPVNTVGVMGDERTYENVISIRAVESRDAMTADWARLPYEIISRISSRIINEVKGINRVVYDVSSKPPSTIEWE